MKKRSVIILLVGLFMLTVNITPQTARLPSMIYSGSTVTWRVDVAPQDITIMYYSEGGNMLAENESLMSCMVGSLENDVSGTFAIGNITVTANDTEIARDLVLGVWGSPTEWWPGFFIETGQSNIESLNETAYASAERVTGNYLNGTITSRYENVSLAIWNSTSETYDLVEEECIIFDYEQDPTGFGEPQVTHLTYSLRSGVLVKANTSYSFGIPYNLVINLAEILHPPPVDFTVNLNTMIVIVGFIGGGVLAVIVIIYIRSNR